jgi:hypothetical protein
MARQPKVSRLRLYHDVIAYFPIKGKTIIIIVLHPLGIFIGVDGEGGSDWSRGPHSRRWHNISVGGSLLTHLLFFIGVAEDDDLAVIGCPEKVAVEITE